MKKTLLTLGALALLLCAAPSCSYDDTELVNRISEVQRRLQAWEDQRDALEQQIKDMQAIVNAINSYDWVKSVEEIRDASGAVTGYILNFSQTGKVTIKNGEPGAVPAIGVKLAADGYYYWTLDGEYILDSEGKKVPATPNINGISVKDGVTPQLKIDEDGGEAFWFISYDQGATWHKLGKAAGGGSAFKKVDVSNLSYIELTLVDDSVLRIPRYAAVRIGGSDSNETLEVGSDENVAIVLPETLKEGDFVAIKARIETSAGTAVSVAVKSATTPWSVEVKMPSFNAEGVYNNDAAVHVVAPADVAVGETVLLEVTVVDRNGALIETARPLKYVKKLSASECADLSAAATANCYIVSAAGDYKFNATVIGNGAAGLTDAAFHTSDPAIAPVAAKLIWADAGVIDALAFDNGYILLSVSAKKGNAVVAAVNASETVLWSWHIWATDQPEDIAVSNADAGNYTLMDRNLGAISALKEDGDKTWGLIYQWGRKDAINPNSFIKNEGTDKVSIAETIKNPSTFYRAGEGTNANGWETSGNANLWSDTQKTIYDPCPAGYKLASHAQITKFTGANTAFTADYAGGLEFNATETTKIWFPRVKSIKGGDGGVQTDDRADYWGSTPKAGDSNRSYRLYFKKNTWNVSDGGRAYAFAVRCVKEQ